MSNRIFRFVFATLALTFFLFSSVFAQEKYARQSVLSSGNWYKLGLKETGIYKLTYSDLSGLGINVDGIDPRNIRIYHNGGGVLPELNKVVLCQTVGNGKRKIPVFIRHSA